MAVSSAQKKVDCWVVKMVVQMVVSSAQKKAGRKADCLAETTAVKTVGSSAQKTHLALLTVQASLAARILITRSFVVR